MAYQICKICGSMFKKMAKNTVKIVLQKMRKNMI